MTLVKQKKGSVNPEEVFCFLIKPDGLKTCFSADDPTAPDRYYFMMKIQPDGFFGFEKYIIVIRLGFLIINKMPIIHHNDNH